jgi:DNA-binding MarR family transcriptional regulator
MESSAAFETRDEPERPSAYHRADNHRGGVAQPSMTALVTGLERAGLVERRQEPGDRRVVLVALSSAGADYLKSRRRAGAEAFVQLIDKLPCAAVAALVAATSALQHVYRLNTEQRAAAGPVHQGVSQGELNA